MTIEIAVMEGLTSWGSQGRLHHNTVYKIISGASKSLLSRKGREGCSEKENAGFKGMETRDTLAGRGGA